MSSNHCSICVISPQMNQDVGCVERKWGRFCFQKEMPRQIDPPAVTCQCLTCLQPLWMVPAHHFAHVASVDINSSHSWDLSPAMLQTKKWSLWKDTQWMSPVHLAYRPKLTTFHLVASSCKETKVNVQKTKKRKIPEMQKEWHLLDKWRTTCMKCWYWKVKTWHAYGVMHCTRTEKPFNGNLNLWWFWNVYKDIRPLPQNSRFCSKCKD